MNIQIDDGRLVDVTDLVAETMADVEYAGICLHCGQRAYGVDPDARDYPCEGCGRRRVVGAEELLLGAY